MSKQHYFCRLLPPRPTWPFDITDDEKRLMGEHAAYTKAFFNAGEILIYGPVLAPGGAFGMAVFEVDDEAVARKFLENDPTVRAGLMKFELYPMKVAAARELDSERR